MPPSGGHAINTESLQPVNAASENLKRNRWLPLSQDKPLYGDCCFQGLYVRTDVHVSLGVVYRSSNLLFMTLNGLVAHLNWLIGIFLTCPCDKSTENSG